MIELSEHFSYEEFVRSETAERKGLDNTPTDEHLENGIAFCETVLEPFRAWVHKEVGQELALITTSFYRSTKVNTAVGGSRNSDHKRGQGWDGIIQTFTAKESFLLWTRWFAETGVPYNQLLFEYSWVHVGVGPNMRHQMKHFRPSQ